MTEISNYLCHCIDPLYYDDKSSGLGVVCAKCGKNSAADLNRQINKPAKKRA